MQMKREDRRAIKRMDKQQLTAYMERVFRRGYEAGAKAMAEQMKKPAANSDSREASDASGDSQ